MQKNIGFIGLGVMGQSMAGHLLDAGHKLRLFTRTPAKAQPLLDRGARWADSPADLARDCDKVFTIVGFPRDVEEVYLGPAGLIENMQPGTVLTDMTTSSPELARRIATAAAERGGQALDAPVSGGDKGAREATLSIMVGGDRGPFERILPLLQCMGRNIVYQGPAGSGQHCKMCNQIAIASNMLGVCEAMAYARQSGLDPQTVLQSISTGAAGSWSLSNLAPRMLAGDFNPGFYVKHFIKDMTIAAESADGLALETPGLDLALQLYRRLAEQGHADDGTQALYRLFS
ncbi:MAG: NAD(P)-dependent oxidoreductase [Kiritimatiellia bacterium]